MMTWQSLSAAGGAGTAAEAAERVGAPGVSGGMVLEMVGALLLVVLVIVVLAWLLRGMQRLGGHWREDLRMIGQIPLGTRERAVVVQVGSEQFLLGVGPGQVRFLCRLQEPLDSQVGDRTSSAGFARLLERFRNEPGKPTGGDA